MTGTDSIYSTELYKAFPIGKKFEVNQVGNSVYYQIKSYYGYHINVKRLSDNEKLTITINELINLVAADNVYDEDGTRLTIRLDGSIVKNEDSE
tara:strand:- start:844 stop:1125 length:282 start_codon:yes stop_codon:yes gene_type:complete